MARILIADDEAQIRLLLRQILEKEGHEVEEAADGRAVLSMYRENPFDIIILDLIMPEKEGVETLMELKNDFEDVKVIAISGGGRLRPDSYLSLAKRLGALYTFTKPVEQEDLLNAIQEILD